MDGARGVGELHAHGGQAADQGQVDGLLLVHEEVVVRVLDVVDHLEVQRGVAEVLEVDAVQPHLLQRFHELAYLLRDGLELIGRGLVEHPELEGHAPLLHAAVVADAAGEEVVVGEDQLLAAEAADAGGLQAHVLDGAQEVPHDDEVADHEGLVQRDGERGEEVGQDVLQGQGHGDAADAQAGHQGGDVHARDVVQGHQEDHGEEDHAGHEEHGVQGGDPGAPQLIGVAPAMVGGPGAQQRVAPDPRLDHDGDHHQAAQPAGHGGGDRQGRARRQDQRQPEQQRAAGVHQRSDQRAHPGPGVGGPGVGQPRAHDPQDAPQQRHATEEHGGGHEPVLQGPVPEAELEEGDVGQGHGPGLLGRGCRSMVPRSAAERKDELAGRGRRRCGLRRSRPPPRPPARPGSRPPAAAAPPCR